ncbi:MAG: aminodeoxychorismate/anthranilate synthase component II [Enterobacterales bacterium]|nr:aminodeoxychorismate/anthranilate synthase component II [Enterobacterales bacterium]
MIKLQDLEILLIDNFDSFTYNLVEQLRGSVKAVKIFRNNIPLDYFLSEVIEPTKPQIILLSPGPGNPQSAGICLSIIEQCKGKLPILGICLGHQAIVEAFNGKVSSAKSIIHGKACNITLDEEEAKLFAGLHNPFRAARYHSLAASQIPEELKVIANAKQEVMAIKHRNYPILGYQFHPESILTTQGNRLMQQSIEWLIQQHNFEVN